MAEQRGLFPRTASRTPDKASMSLLSRIDVCPYSGCLYLDFGGGAQTAAMARGELIHAAIEHCVNECLGSGEVEIPPEIARDVAQAMIEERVDLPIPADEQDVIRACLFNWARGFVLDPANVVGVEQMLELQIGDWTIRGKLDLAEIAEGIGYVTDWKTSLAITPREVFQNDFQGQLYCLLLAEGVPEGETVPLGRGLSEFCAKQRFPRHDPTKFDPAVLPGPDAWYDRTALADFKRTLVGHLAKLDHGLQNGEWAAAPGSHCRTCPAQQECPIPEQLRDIRSIGTADEAHEVCERILFLDSERALLNGAAKDWISENEPIVIGGEIFNFFPQQREDWRRQPGKTQIGSKEEVKQLLREHGYDPDEFWKQSSSSPFRHKALRTDE